MTTDDRDSLARMFFATRGTQHWQAWEQTSEGIRDWCRAKADEAMAAGWRKVGVEECVVRRDDADECAMTILSSGVYQEEHGNPKEAEYLSAMGNRMLAASRAALADPAGANGGE